MVDIDVSHLQAQLADGLKMQAASMREDQELLRVYQEINKLSHYTILLTLALELFSLPSALKLVKGNPSLYASAVFKNFFNHYLIAPAMFSVYVRYYVLPGHTCDVTKFPFDPLSPPDYSWCEYDRWTTFLQMLGVLLIQSIGYYLAHVLMHTRRFYWMHRFHHKFNNTVTPMVANAVSWAEYAVAYMLPIFVATVLLKPNVPALFRAGFIISFFNLLIHTPFLHDLSERLPGFWVSTAGHMEHHRVLSRHFAAPTLNVDWVVGLFVGSMSEEKRQKLFKQAKEE
ncbi:unnamed protein product [Amoebophrya sp. A120]|nr:unnamed protein product [Amoebophrya sp. A120]|eukprot:GSA120T00003730001.1